MSSAILRDDPSVESLFNVAGTETLALFEHLSFENTSSRLVVTHGAGELNHVSSILVAVAGGPHSGAAVETARALAVDHDAWIDLLHVVEPDASDERQAQARQYLEESQQRLQGFDRHDTWLLEADDVVDATAEQSAYDDVNWVGPGAVDSVDLWISHQRRRNECGKCGTHRLEWRRDSMRVVRTREVIRRVTIRS
ncbi:MAG: universal stress protein family [Haloquadratum sp. J07HQX50]|nr:MAG: universal stress protein family [Haloquadratum sp. J07HQX50]